jgi:hypothetical protein
MANIGCIVAESQLIASMACYPEKSVTMTVVLCIISVRTRNKVAAHLVHHEGCNIQPLRILDIPIEFFCPRTSSISKTHLEAFEVDSEDRWCLKYLEALGSDSFRFTAE